MGGGGIKILKPGYLIKAKIQARAAQLDLKLWRKSYQCVGGRDTAVSRDSRGKREGGRKREKE